MITKGFIPKKGTKVFAIMNYRNLPLLLWRMLLARRRPADSARP